MKVSTAQITETVAPTVEPVTRDEAKLHGGVTWAQEDSLIDIYISAARKYCEKFLQRSLVQRTYRADISGFYDELDLPGGPVLSIESIRYYNTDSPTGLTTLSSDVYTLYGNYVVRNTGQSWPSVYSRPDAVQITYVAGYAASTDSPQDFAANVPEDIKAAIFLLLQDLYENREAQITGTITTRNRTVDLLLDANRNYR